MGAPQPANLSETRRKEEGRSGGPFVFTDPLSDLRTVTVDRKSLSSALGREEYARRFDLPPERVEKLLKEIGIADSLVGRLSAQIEEHRQAEAFKAIAEACPAGKRLLSLDFPVGFEPKEIFEMLGTIVFCTTLLADDKALAGEVCRFFGEGPSSLQGLSLREFSGRIEANLIEESGRELPFIPQLLSGELAGENGLEQTFFLRGLLAAYFQAEHAAENSNTFKKRLLHLLNVFHIPPEQLRDLDDEKLTRGRVRFLRSLRGEDTEASAPGFGITADGVNPKLLWALDNLKGVQALDAVSEFLDSVPEISVPDLGYILSRIPQGVNWGERTDRQCVNSLIDEMAREGIDTSDFGGFLGWDIIILNRALSLCNGKGEAAGAPEFGPCMKRIINKSRTSVADYHSYSYTPFWKSLYIFFEGKMKKILGRILGEIS